MYTTYANPYNENSSPTESPVRAKVEWRGVWIRVTIQAAIVAGFIQINNLGLYGNIATFGLLILMSLGGGLRAFQALTLLGLMIHSNTFIVTFTAIAAPLRMVTLLIACLILLSQSLPKLSHPRQKIHINALIIFCSLCAVMSIINQYYVIISLLKLFSFGLGVVALLSFAEAQRHLGAKITEWYVVLITYTVVAGVIGWRTGFGYGRDTLITGQELYLFRGVLNHSQTMGSIGAMMFIFMLCVYQFTAFPGKGLQLILMGGLAWQVYLSQSRTGMGALVLAAGILIWLTLGRLYQRYSKYLHLNRGKLVTIGIFVLMAGLSYEAFTGGKGSSSLRDFILKGRAEEISTETVLSSRMPIINQSIALWKSNPFMGIGFGTSTGSYFIRNASFFSAPTEKGFLPTALLEETGLIGFFSFFSFVFVFMRKFFAEHNVAGVAGLSALLLVNLGEMMIFSLGAMGLLGWTLVVGMILLGSMNVSDGHMQRGP
jgi:hypothetical protein